MFKRGFFQMVLKLNKKSPNIMSFKRFSVLVLAQIMIFSILYSSCNSTSSSAVDDPAAKIKKSVAAEDTVEKLEVYYVANAGVLLVWKDKKLLIDAIHQPYSSYYRPTPDSLLNKMMEGRAPFDDIDVLLISHVHGDHFHAKTVASFLAANPMTQLVGAPQMRDSLAAISNDFSLLQDRIHTFSYQSGQSHFLEISGIKLTLYDLIHGHDRNKWVENLASIVELGAHRILHVGDPDLSVAPFDAFHFEEQNVTLGLLPDWLLTSKTAKQLVDSRIAPQEIIAVHVSPQWEKDSREKMNVYFPEATLFTQPMESRFFIK